MSSAPPADATRIADVVASYDEHAMQCEILWALLRIESLLQAGGAGAPAQAPPRRRRKATPKRSEG